MASVTGALLSQLLTRAVMSVLLAAVAAACIVLLAWARDRRDAAYRRHWWSQLDQALMAQVRTLDAASDEQATGSELEPHLRLLRPDRTLHPAVQANEAEIAGR